MLQGAIGTQRAETTMAMYIGILDQLQWRTDKVTFRGRYDFNFSCNGTPSESE